MSNDLVIFSVQHMHIVVMISSSSEFNNLMAWWVYDGYQRHSPLPKVSIVILIMYAL
jgi:hypothetical protein